MSVLTIGHVTLDLFFQLPQARINLRPNAPDELCLPYGDKLMLHNMQLSLGGNAPNVGLGLVKLGLETELYSQVGRDYLGELTMRLLGKSGLALDCVRQAGRTDLSAVLTYQSERTILAYHPQRTWQFRLSSSHKPVAIYLTSLGTSEFEDFHHELGSWLERNPKVSLFYNPGKNELEVGLERLKILQRVHVLYLNKQEAGQLLAWQIDEQTGATEVRKLAIKLQQAGPEKVIITDGGNGAYAFDGQNFYHQPIFPTRVVERTGAGDAFSSGSMAALLQGYDLAKALRWGSAQAFAVIKQVGATKGLLTRDQLDEILCRHSTVLPRQL